MLLQNIIRHVWSKIPNEAAEIHTCAEIVSSDDNFNMVIHCGRSMVKDELL
jgi:hypothetical protein